LIVTSTNPASVEKCVDAGSGEGWTTGLAGEEFCGGAAGACAREIRKATSRLKGSASRSDARSRTLLKNSYCTLPRTVMPRPANESLYF
jgi:hypothetical protein